MKSAYRGVTYDEKHGWVSLFKGRKIGLWRSQQEARAGYELQADGFTDKDEIRASVAELVKLGEVTPAAPFWVSKMRKRRLVAGFNRVRVRLGLDPVDPGK